MISNIFMALKRAFLCLSKRKAHLLGAGVFCDSLGTFGNGVFCQFTGQQKSDGCLDFSAGDGRSFVVVSQAGRFGSNSFKDVIHERIHDRHSLGRNTGVRMDLFQDFVNVDSERFLPALLPLLFVTSSYRFLGLSGLFNGFTRSLGRHNDMFSRRKIEMQCRKIKSAAYLCKTGGISSQTSSRPIENRRGWFLMRVERETLCVQLLLHILKAFLSSSDK